MSGEGFSALGTGLAIFAYALGAAITASAADGIAAKIGNRVLLLASVMLVAGMLAMVATAVLVGTDPHIWSWIPAMGLSGLGFGLFVPPVIDIVLVNVDRSRAGIASGGLATFQQVGGALGVAVLGVVFFGLVGAHAPQAARDAAPTITSALDAGSTSDAQSQQISDTFVGCFTAQARSADPTATPPGCAVPEDTPASVVAAYGQAARQATSDTFSTSFTQALWYQVAIYLLTLLLVLRLPTINPRQLAELDTASPSAS